MRAGQFGIPVVHVVDNEARGDRHPAPARGRLGFGAGGGAEFLKRGNHTCADRTAVARALRCHAGQVSAPMRSPRGGPALRVRTARPGRSNGGTSLPTFRLACCGLVERF
ncbi:hypothetical protein HRbin30_01369 [bacterium HR30]|nr:hypothetical protein HRbin30_01369 [bacterium HR30]